MPVRGHRASTTRWAQAQASTLPGGVTFDGSSIFVADTGNHAIRQIILTGSVGSVSTLAGDGTPGFTSTIRPVPPSGSPPPSPWPPSEAICMYRTRETTSSGKSIRRILASPPRWRAPPRSPGPPTVPGGLPASIPRKGSRRTVFPWLPSTWRTRETTPFAALLSGVA